MSRHLVTILGARSPAVIQILIECIRLIEKTYQEAG